MTYTEAVRPHTSSRLREPQTAPAPPRAQSAARLERGPHTHNARPHNSTTQNPPPTRKDTGEDGKRDTCQHGTWACTERVQVNYLPLWGTESQLHTHLRVRGPHATSSEERGRVPFDPGRREGGCLSAPGRSVRLWRGPSRNSSLSRVYRALSSRL